MAISLDQLLTFVAVAESGSFTAAARKLGKAQSTVSEMIIQLEIECNLVLFDRSHRTPPLTEEGLSLLREARWVLSSSEIFKSKAEELSKGLESRVTLAYDPLVMPIFELQEKLSEFQANFPFVELELLSLHTNDILNHVRNERVDLALIRFQTYRPVGLEAFLINNVQLRQVAAADHPLSKLEVVTPNDFHRYHKFVLTSLSNPEPLHHSSVTNYLWYFDDLGAMLKIIRRGLGWSLLPTHSVEEDIKAGHLVYLNALTLKKPLSIAVQLIWGKARPLGPAAIWLRDQFSHNECE